MSSLTHQRLRRQSQLYRMRRFLLTTYNMFNKPLKFLSWLWKQCSWTEKMTSMGSEALGCGIKSFDKIPFVCSKSSERAKHLQIIIKKYNILWCLTNTRNLFMFCHKNVDIICCRNHLVDIKLLSIWPFTGTEKMFPIWRRKKKYEFIIG